MIRELVLIANMPGNVLSNVHRTSYLFLVVVQN